jgi:hypothetical protein
VSYIITKVEVGEEHLAFLDTSPLLKESGRSLKDDVDPAETNHPSETEEEGGADRLEERRRPVAPPLKGVSLLKLPFESHSPVAD